MIFGPKRNVLKVAARFLDFFVEEGCGYCTPCRVGMQLMQRKLEEILAGRGETGDLEYLESLGATIKTASRCGLGQTAPNPVLSTLKNFRPEYEALLQDPVDGQRRAFDAKAALAEAEAIAGRESTILQE